LAYAGPQRGFDVVHRDFVDALRHAHALDLVCGLAQARRPGSETRIEDLDAGQCRRQTVEHRGRELVEADPSGARDDLADGAGQRVDTRVIFEWQFTVDMRRGNVVDPFGEWGPHVLLAVNEQQYRDRLMMDSIRIGGWSTDAGVFLVGRAQQH